MWHGVVIFFLFLQEEPGKSDFADGLLFNLWKCFTRYDFVTLTWSYWIFIQQETAKNENDLTLCESMDLIMDICQTWIVKNLLFNIPTCVICLLQLVGK